MAFFIYHGVNDYISHLASLQGHQTASADLMTENHNSDPAGRKQPSSDFLSCPLRSRRPSCFFGACQSLNLFLGTYPAYTYPF